MPCMTEKGESPSVVDEDAGQFENWYVDIRSDGLQESFPGGRFLPPARRQLAGSESPSLPIPWAPDSSWRTSLFGLRPGAVVLK